MLSTTKVRTGEFFRHRLDSDALRFFLSNADQDSQPPYGVVTVTELRETTPESNAFHAEIKIAVITSIDDHSSREHDNILAEVMKKLEVIPRRVVDPEAEIRLFGWLITLNETVLKDESQSLSDVITILAGVGG